MNTEIHAMFQPLIMLTGAQNSRTVTTDSGTAAYCMKGIRLPRGFLLRSDREAIHGSVIASKMRVKVSRPPTTSVAMPYPILAE